MRVKMKFFRLIMAGTKSLEVRVAYSNLQSIVPESQIKLVSGNDQGVIRVVAVRKYADFESMLAQESAEHIVPGMSAPDVLRLLREIYPPHKEVLGVLVLQIQPLRAGR
jgi:ASC-1-like (ASCH) protein